MCRTAETKKKGAKKQILRRQGMRPTSTLLLNSQHHSGRNVSVLYEGTDACAIWMELIVEKLEWLQENVKVAEPKARKSRGQTTSSIGVPAE